MPSDQQVQELVYRVEEGSWVKWVKLTALLSVMIALFVTFILDPWYPYCWGFYKGLNHPKAMEQAQIARELARGHKFSTKMIRPIALAQFRENRGIVPTGDIPDTYQAPLWPATLAPFLLAVKHWPESFFPMKPPKADRWQLSVRSYIYVGDRTVSAVAMGFFFLSILVSYFTVRRLFDNHIGIWTVVLMLGCATFWQYSLSGLPQMLMLFLFSCGMYTLVRALEYDDTRRRWPFVWLALFSIFMGLLTLAHGIGFWVFLGALLFCSIYFRPWWKTLLLMGILYGMVTVPWLVHTYRACGNPFGTSLFGALEQIRGTENSIMRSEESDFGLLSPSIFRRKIQDSLVGQFGNIYSALGGLVAAPAFFLALLHLFKKTVPRNFRWALLAMWLSSVLGMAIFGQTDAEWGVTANNLNVLFIPLFAAFGMAFLLVLWVRLEISVGLVKYIFYGVIYAVSALPMVNLLTNGNRGIVQWPPYIPSSIALLRDWTLPDEIIASDMPWAVAWYADRKSIWLPMKIQSFLEYTDYQRLGGRIAGIYLTPVTGNRALISDIVKGDYKEWAPFILRNVNIKDFPMRSVTPMPIDNQCIFFSDRDRWTDRKD